MTALLDLIRYATGNGFPVFLGTIIVLMVIGEALAAIIKAVIPTVIALPKR